MSLTARTAVKVHRAAERAMWVIASIAGIGFCVALVAAVVHGPEVRAAAEQARAAETEQEAAVFCRKYGMAPGSEAFRACATDIEEIRKREHARTVMEFDLP